MAKASEYVTIKVHLLQKTEYAVLVRLTDLSKQAWLPKKIITRAHQTAPDGPDSGLGTYEITAQRWVLKQEGLV